MENQRLWDYSSTETVDDQRKRLVKEYMQLDEIPREWDTAQFTEYSDRQPERIPKAEKIATILRPWLSDNMRKREWSLWARENLQALVMLQIYYKNSSAGNKKITKYTDISDNYTESVDQAVLDNTERFNYSLNWK